MRLTRNLSLAAAAAAFVTMAGSSGALAVVEGKMCIIDGALHITTKGDPGKKLKIEHGGDTLVKDKFKGQVKDDGFVESTHVVDPWDSSAWPPGTYRFTSKDNDGNEMVDTATLDDCEPDSPEIEAINGCEVGDIGEDDPVVPPCLEPDGLPNADVDPVEIDFANVNSCSNIERYTVHLQCEGSPGVTVEVDPDDCNGTCTAEIPNDNQQASDDDVECTVTVTAVDSTCNETSSTLTYMTDNNGA